MMNMDGTGLVGVPCCFYCHRRCCRKQLFMNSQRHECKLRVSWWESRF